jgi:hypothetical protein
MSIVHDSVTHTRDRAHPLIVNVMLFALFVIGGALLAAPSLNADWFFDDLYYVRVYSPDEISAAFAGNWLIDERLGTQGYRPLNIVTVSAVASISADSPLAARAMQIVLFALMLMLVIELALAMGMTRSQAILAAVCILVARNTWWMLVWATDLPRVVAAILVLITLCLHVRSQSAAAQIIGIACFACALLIREESASFALVMPLVGYVKFRDLRRAVITAIPLSLCVIAMFALRRAVVPASDSTIFPLGYLLQVSFALLPRLFTDSLLSLIALVAFWALMLLSRPPKLAWLWLICVAITSAHGLIVSRGNNALLPIVFLGLFIGACARDHAGTQRRLALAGAVLFIVGSVIAHRDAQRALAPNSAERVDFAQRMLYGDWDYVLPYIPDSRLEGLRASAQIAPEDTQIAPPIVSGF